MLLSLLKNKLFQGSGLLAFFAILTKLSGFWRDRILASQFGASTQLDIYYSAFKIPDLIFNLFVLGAISSAVIPVFLEHYRKNEKEGWKLASNFMTVTTGVVLVISFVAWIFASPLSRIVAPGFAEADHQLLVDLLRVMLLSPILFSISSTLGSLLQAIEQFGAYALAPIFYNVGIIFGALYFAPLAPRFGYTPVMGLGVGVVFGVFLHLIAQLPSIIKEGFRFSLIFDLKNLGLRKIFRLMVPRTLALGTFQIGLIVITAIASLLEAGNITVLNLAINLQAVPLSILGISIATALFPQLSHHVVEQDMKSFKNKMNHALLGTLGSVSVVALTMFIFRYQIVRVLFDTGNFGEADQRLTASILGIFMLSVVAQSLMHIMTRAFYALQDTKTPFLIALFAIVLTVGLGYFFAIPLGWGLQGLAWGMAIAYNVNFLLLYLSFRKKYF